MSFPTIRHDPNPPSHPCPHAFPYTVTDGKADVSPCEKCGTPWQNRDDDYPNSLVRWSLPDGLLFGERVNPTTFLPMRDAPADPGWFTPEEQP